MIRIQYFNFIIWKFLQMPKLLCNVLKISGGQMPKCPPPLVAPCPKSSSYACNFSPRFRGDRFSLLLSKQLCSLVEIL